MIRPPRSDRSPFANGVATAGAIGRPAAAGPASGSPAPAAGRRSPAGTRASSISDAQEARRCQPAAYSLPSSTQLRLAVAVDRRLPCRRRRQQHVPPPALPDVELAQVALAHVRGARLSALSRPGEALDAAGVRQAHRRRPASRRAPSSRLGSSSARSAQPRRPPAARGDRLRLLRRRAALASAPRRSSRGRCGRKASCWQRESTVSGRRSSRSASRMMTVPAGGSSSVLRKAFAASRRSVSAASTMATRRPPAYGLSESTRSRRRTWQMRRSRLSAWSLWSGSSQRPPGATTSTSGWCAGEGVAAGPAFAAGLVASDACSSAPRRTRAPSRACRRPPGRVNS